MTNEKSMAWRHAVNLIAAGADYCDFSDAMANAMADGGCRRTFSGSFFRFEFSDGSALVEHERDWDIGFSATQCRDPEIIARVQLADKYGTIMPNRPMEFIWQREIPA